jgi:hypothetical protein
MKPDEWNDSGPFDKLEYCYTMLALFQDCKNTELEMIKTLWQQVHELRERVNELENPNE